MNTPVRFYSLSTFCNFLYIVGNSTPNSLFIVTNKYRIITEPQIVALEVPYNRVINIQQIAALFALAPTIGKAIHLVFAHILRIYIVITPNPINLFSRRTYFFNVARTRVLVSRPETA